MCIRDSSSPSLMAGAAWTNPGTDSTRLRLAVARQSWSYNTWMRGLLGGEWPDPDEQIGPLLLIPSMASKRHDFSRLRLARDASDDQAMNLTNDRERPRSTR